MLFILHEFPFVKCATLRFEIPRWPVQIGILLIVLSYIFETIITIIVNPKEQLAIIRHDTSEGSFTQERANTFRGRAATFIGFTIVIATFLLSSDNPHPDLDTALEFVWLTLGFLLLSYQMKSLTNLNRFWINLQEKTFEYGFLSLLGLIFIFSIPYGENLGAYALWIGISLVVIFRFYAVYKLIKGLSEMWERQTEKSRSEYFADILISRYHELTGNKE